MGIDILDIFVNPLVISLRAAQLFGSKEWSTFFNDQKEPQPVLPGRLQNLDSARRIYLKVQLSLCKPNIQQLHLLLKDSALQNLR